MTEPLGRDDRNQDDGDFLVRHDIAMAESVIVRTLLAGEVDRYRELRLMALLDSPNAFTATWAEESAMADSAWEARVELSLSGGSAIVVADTGRELVGLAGGIPWGTRARVVSVWVASAWRHRGLAQRLVERVCEWAAAGGYAEAQIETALGNSGPQSLYERLGFVPVDEEPPPHCGPVLVRQLSFSGSA
jgi:GNAT superfamily N-acetyltransferase